VRQQFIDPRRRMRLHVEEEVGEVGDGVVRRPVTCPHHWAANVSPPLGRAPARAVGPPLIIVAA
jgi:hypothetical protein